MLCLDFFFLPCWSIYHGFQFCVFMGFMCACVWVSVGIYVFPMVLLCFCLFIYLLSVCFSKEREKEGVELGGWRDGRTWKRWRRENNQNLKQENYVWFFFKALHKETAVDKASVCVTDEPCSLSWRRGRCAEGKTPPSKFRQRVREQWLSI